jgi:hypothetical protein
VKFNFRLIEREQDAAAGWSVEWGSGAETLTTPAPASQPFSLPLCPFALLLRASVAAATGALGLEAARY